MIQHTISVGMSYAFNESMLLSLAYVHGFKGSETGTALQAQGVNVRVDSEYDSLGFNFKFGAGCSTAPAIFVPAETPLAGAQVTSASTAGAASVLSSSPSAPSPVAARQDASVPASSASVPSGWWHSVAAV